MDNATETKMNRQNLTPALCYAAGRDAGNRSMREAGRAAWNESDFNAAAKVTNELLEKIAA